MHPMRLLVLLLGCVCRFYVAAQTPTDDNSGSACSDVDAAVNIDSMGKWRVFNQLSPLEIDSVLNFFVDEVGLYHNIKSRLDPPPTIDGPDILYRVELLEPVKAEVLSYLDNNGPEPSRFAKACVIRSTKTPKDVMEYKIGPLPLNIGARKPESEIGLNGDDSPVTGVIMEKLRSDGEITYNKRPAEPRSSAWVFPLVEREAYKLRQIFKETTGWCYGADRTDLETIAQSLQECGFGLIQFLSYPTLTTDPDAKITHLYWFFKTRRGGSDEFNLHPVPLSFKVEERGTNITEWRAFDFEYCHQGPFATSDELLAAYTEGRLVRCAAEDWKDFNYDESWARTNDPISPRPGAEKAAPRTFYPEGPRFNTRTEGTGSGTGFLFEYHGWEGHVSMRYGTGIVFHDIRFRGERIVYELALQEQYVAYSGYGGGGQTIFLDSYFGLGLASSPMRRGIDCPETAQYMPATKLFRSGLVGAQNDVICIFEEDAQTSEWRHTHGNGTDGPHLDGVRRSTLVIRTVATVGNYDYIYSIRFRQDASISVETAQGGYMLATFHDVDGQTSRDDPFGTRVHKHTYAMLHDHLSGWKVDVDVLGTENSLLRQSVKVGTWEEALASSDQADTTPPAWHQGSFVKYIDRERVDSEFGFLIRDQGTVIHTFANEKQTNSWGQPRGYTIKHGMTARQLLPDSHPITKAAAWTKYHLAVTQRKETETLSHTAMFDWVAPGSPITSLDDYINEESIVENDLVAWVMIGIFHIPRSEDVPLISNVGAHFVIKPWNYFDELVSLDAGTQEEFTPCQPNVGSGFNYNWSRF